MKAKFSLRNVSHAEFLYASTIFIHVSIVLDTITNFCFYRTLLRDFLFICVIFCFYGRLIPFHTIVLPLSQRLIIVHMSRRDGMNRDDSIPNIEVDSDEIYLLQKTWQDLADRTNGKGMMLYYDFEIFWDRVNVDCSLHRD